MICKKHNDTEDAFGALPSAAALEFRIPGSFQPGQAQDGGQKIDDTSTPAQCREIRSRTA